jgi:hypothetical protein
MLDSMEVARAMLRSQRMQEPRAASRAALQLGYGLVATLAYCGERFHNR